MIPRRSPSAARHRPPQGTAAAALPTLCHRRDGGAADDVIALKGYRGWRVFRWVISATTGSTAFATPTDEHITRELGFDESELTRIPNGVDMSPFAQTRLPERVRRSRSSAASRTRRGRVWELLHAFARVTRAHPDSRCSVAGDGRGGRGDALPAAAAERGLDARCSPAGASHTRSWRLLRAQRLPRAALLQRGSANGSARGRGAQAAIVATDVGDLRRLFDGSYSSCRVGDADDLPRAMAEALEPANLERVDYADMVPSRR